MRCKSWDFRLASLTGKAHAKARTIRRRLAAEDTALPRLRLKPLRPLDQWRRTYPKRQILTLAELFQGKKPHIPFVDPSSLKREAGGYDEPGDVALIPPPARGGTKCFAISLNRSFAGPD